LPIYLETVKTKEVVIMGNIGRTNINLAVLTTGKVWLRPPVQELMPCHTIPPIPGSIGKPGEKKSDLCHLSHSSGCTIVRILLRDPNQKLCFENFQDEERQMAQI